MEMRIAHISPRKCQEKNYAIDDIADELVFIR